MLLCNGIEKEGLNRVQGQRQRQVRQIMEETTLATAREDALGDLGQGLTPGAGMFRVHGRCIVTVSLGHQS